MRFLVFIRGVRTEPPMMEEPTIQIPLRDRGMSVWDCGSGRRKDGPASADYAEADVEGDSGEGKGVGGSLLEEGAHVELLDRVGEEDVEHEGGSENGLHRISISVQSRGIPAIPHAPACTRAARSLHMNTPSSRAAEDEAKSDIRFLFPPSHRRTVTPR